MSSRIFCKLFVFICLLNIALSEITTFISFSNSVTDSKVKNQTIFYIHDWNTRTLNKTIEVSRTILKSRNDVRNVIIADWSTFSQSPDYYNVAQRFTSRVAEDVLAEIRRVIDKDAVGPENIECIGHGMGAHICAQVGKIWNTESDEKLEKITGLDPNGPYFKDHLGESLSGDDAKNVEAWHTDKRFGIYSDIGEVNFYPPLTEPEIQDCKRKKPLKRNQCLHNAVRDIFLRNLTSNLSTINNGFPNPKHPMSIITLDVSPSMKNFGRIQSMVASTKRLIQSLPLGYFIGIVIFGGEAQVSLLPVNISDDTISRLLISSRLPTVATEISNTSIGAGIEKAFDVAEPYLKSGEFCPDIILVTDGEENKAPYIRDIQPRLKDVCTKIHTIALGDDADVGLEALSDMTRGQVYFASDVNSLDKLTQSLVASSTAQFEGNIQPILLPSKTLRLDDTAPSASFQLDESIAGNNASFIISTANPGEVKAELIAPNGDAYGVNNYAVDTDLHQLLFKLLEVQAGNWTIKLNSRDSNPPKRRRRSPQFENNNTATIYVTSYPSAKEDQEPIRLEAFLSDRILDHDGMPIAVEAHLYQRESPIINAKIVAEIHASDGTKVVMELLDNGAGADEEKDDGIYTRYITHGLIPGRRYQVEVKAVSDENGSTRKRSSDSDPFKISKDDLVKIEYNFERQASAGSFRVASQWKYTALPPNPITNLEVLEVDEELRTSTLQWTAAGGESDSGTSDSLQLKAFTSRTPEVDAFVFTKSDVISGSLDPLPSGSRQNVTVKVPDMLWEEAKNSTNSALDLYFTIRSESTASGFSSPSNIAPAEFAIPLNTNDNLILILCISVLLICVIFGLVAFIYLRRRMRHFKIQQSLKKSETNF